MTLSRSALPILSASALILAISLGVRHSFGLYLEPISQSYGWGREVFAFAIALQNLLWGLAQPFTGALADRFGTAKAVFIGGLFYAIGLGLMALSDTPTELALSAGILIGLGLSGTSFSVLLAAVGRAVPEKQRSMAMGIAAAAGSFGQFAMLPAALGLNQSLGWADALLALAVLTALLLPLAFILGKAPTPTAAPANVRQALSQIRHHTAFWLLGLGFFVCGFQVVFIGIHLPAYLVDEGLNGSIATTVLALVGLFNIAGTYIAGALGNRFCKTKLLCALYALRAVVIGFFFYLPTTEISAYLFGIAMGLLWLSTVPLTNGSVATFFGVANLSMLGGIVFLWHQLGSFLGGWLGGYLYDQTGSYDYVWCLAIALSLCAVLINAPILEGRARCKKNSCS